MLKIIPIPAFQDNYIWLIHPVDRTLAWVVDPGEAGKVINYLEANELTLAGILVTHHHADHTGGIESLLAYRDVPVIGPDSQNIHSLTRHVSEGDIVNIAGFTFDVFNVPGHTLDHIAFYCSGLQNAMAPILFCGDTLFAGGCGRIFEGNPPMMYKSLQKLAALPGNTQVYCTHEYTLANLNFACSVLPESKALKGRMNQEKMKRNLHLPTVPTSIAAELKSNIFLRCDENEVRAVAEQHCAQRLESEVEVFAAIRSWKDSF